MTGDGHPVTTYATIPAAMPRQPRLDATGALHHVMLRRVERTAIFRENADRAGFVTRVTILAEQGAWTVYAWVLLPNHAHLLVRTALRLLARSMRSLLIPPWGRPSIADRETSATSSRSGNPRKLLAPPSD